MRSDALERKAPVLTLLLPGPPSDQVALVLGVGEKLLV